ncbi:MAG: glycoside hydrolase family 97 catalytic domain-containing protein [Cellvibrio sp.]|uniref:glycoside hydrolase family 97 catalytic domain-containing protein n=1 Tax=Cellvibrio sp. TaxID=1965322 RepID=UPI00271D1C3C|nr:glycoside hydrolase family 97 catalytic domain-containing protein [Cellvibrio sp.]
MSTKKIFRNLWLLLIALGSAPLYAASFSQISPNGEIIFSINDDAGVPSYSVKYRGEEVIQKSRLGLEFKDADGFARDLKIAQHVTSSSDSTWEQPWGEQRVMRDHHNELLVTFTGIRNSKKTMNLRVRVFDDGLGFRYEVPDQKNISPKRDKRIDIIDEKTEFVIPSPDKTTAWWIPSRNWNRYEFLYRTTSIRDLDRAHTPLTFKLPSGVHLSIHEAALTDYAAMTLDQQRDGVLKADLTPWSDGVRVKTKLGFQSSWRTIQIASNASGLINSSLILNLNEPNKLGDVSWVKPGKYIGIWWGMHVNKNTWGSGPKHGATTENTKAYMDFAAQYGFDGVLVEGWNEGWDGDWFCNGDIFSFTKPYKDFDIAEITRYGLSKDVRLVGHHETSGAVTNYKNQMDAAYDLYKKHGVTQIKTGYVADGGKAKRIDENGIVRNEWHDGQFMIGEYLRSVTEAAERHISINTHEPIKDTGLRRTYPNWIAREGARGQEYNAWGSPPNSPEHTVMLPYTRMLSGPMDYTPGIFNLAPYGLAAENRVQSTLAKELALYVIIYSPIQMAADLIENYLQADGKTIKPAFQFILDVPTDWEVSKSIAGEVGDYSVIARKERNGQDWYLGAITDENARNISVELNFLDVDKQYEAQIYRDGPKAEWKTNPYDMVIEKKIVTAKDKLKFNLGTSGGVAIRFKAVAKAQGKPVVYQIFTRLYGNTNSTNKPWGTIEENGVGKFNDINAAALKSIKDLGVTHVWYTGVPHHAVIRDYTAYGINNDDPDVVKGRAGSPYAVKDYYNVNPDLAVNPANRLQEFEALIARTHAQGMKVIIDIVPNHVARSYQSLSKPAGVEDFGARDNKRVEYARDNNFYYVVGENFKVPAPQSHYRPLGGDAHPLSDGQFVEKPAKWTGNGSRLAQPKFDDWYETVKINYGVRPDGSKDFPALPTGYAQKDVIAHAQFWQGKSVPDSWIKFRQIAEYWLDKGVDGFRFDMAEMVPVEFWSYLNSSIKLKNPQAFLLAEVYNPKEYRNYIRLGKMDYLYDKVEMYDSLKAIMQGKATTDVIASVQAGMSDIEEHMLHFLENHDEQRIASPEFAGSAEKAKPAMVVSALISRSPTMMYFAQEVGEEGALESGFGDPSRTTIFDYAGVPAHQRFMNGGKFDGGLLSVKEKNLREFYRQLLNLSLQEPGFAGEYRELHSHNRQYAQGYDGEVFSFVRWGRQQKWIVVSNFSATESRQFVLHLPAALVKDWALQEGSYVLVSRLANKPRRFSLQVDKDVAIAALQLAPLESLVLQLMPD